MPNDLIDNGREGIAHKRQSPGEALVHDNAQRKQVRSVVNRLPERLFGRHVRHRAHDGPSLRLRHRCCIVSLGRIGQRFCESEVEYLDPSARCQDEVRTLDIAMNDAERLGLFQSVGDLPRHLQHALDRQRTSLDPGGQLLALDQLHHDEEVVVCLANVERRRDRRRPKC